MYGTWHIAVSVHKLEVIIIVFAALVVIGSSFSRASFFLKGRRVVHKGLPTISGQALRAWLDR